jgi:hypothetical protein
VGRWRVKVGGRLRVVPSTLPAVVFVVEQASRWAGG